MLGAARIGRVRAVRLAALIGLASVSALSACSGSSETAQRNRTFYDWVVATGATGAKEFEAPYPPLDQSAEPPHVGHRGVTVVRGGVRLSRPVNWMLRDGDNTPGQAFVQYISPNAYSFALYERPESVREPWRDVLRRFEDDTQSLGAKIVSGRIPVATFGGQGRAYTVERQVEAGKVPLVSRSREVLLRGATRIVLVQIVHEGRDLSNLDQELLQVIRTIEVL